MGIGVPAESLLLLEEAIRHNVPLQLQRRADPSDPSADDGDSHIVRPVVYVGRTFRTRGGRCQETVPVFDLEERPKSSTFRVATQLDIVYPLYSKG
jgi:hypothetical protein